MKKFEVRGQPIYIPENSDINWGDDVTDAFDTVANAINDSATNEQITEVESYIGQYDVKPTKINAIEDGNWHTIPELTFDKTKVLSVDVNVTVLRRGGSSNETSTMELQAIYDETANDWFVSCMGIGDFETQFDITPDGAFKYCAENIGSTTFQLRFRAEAAAI